MSQELGQWLVIVLQFVAPLTYQQACLVLCRLRLRTSFGQWKKNIKNNYLCSGALQADETLRNIARQYCAYVAPRSFSNGIHLLWNAAKCASSQWNETSVNLLPRKFGPVQASLLRWQKWTWLLSHVLVLKRGITHDLHASDIIWTRGVFDTFWNSVRCMLHVLLCLYRTYFLHVPSRQASTPSGTVSTGTPLGAELSFRRPDTHTHTQASIDSDHSDASASIVIDAIVLSPWIPVYFLPVSQLRYISTLPSAVKAGTCQRKPLPCFLGNLASKPRSHL